ncbi:MAG: hypothetical protein HOQ03_09485 [Thermoleophilia bacterium]|nr:hypothetical protein [Thermoleophilia bacterium]
MDGRCQGRGRCGHLSRDRGAARIGAIDVDRPFVEFHRRSGTALAGLGLLTELRRTLDRLEGALAPEAYARGASWSEIGAELGISRQAAFMRHRVRATRVKQTDGDSPRPFC